MDQSSAVDVVFESLLEQCMFEAAYEAHRDHKLTKGACRICSKHCRCYVVKPGCDVFGNTPSIATAEKIKCVNCSHSFAVVRYAQHLEKCLGIGGRRAATRTVNKPRAIPNISSPTLNDSDPEDYVNKKKRSYSPLPVQPSKYVKLEHTSTEDLAPANKTSTASPRNLTPVLSNNISSRETTPTVPPASLVRTAPFMAINPPVLNGMGMSMLAGKTKPGISLSKAFGSKSPVSGYGKVPRVMAGASNGGMMG